MTKVESDSNSPAEFGNYEHETVPQTKWARWIDSFRPMDFGTFDPNLTDEEKAAIATANSPLSRSLKGRHLQMIAIGGSIGTGLFVGSGGALSTGGPAAVIIAWILIGIMIYFTVQALGELAVVFPVSGSFTTYSTRFVDPSWGFAMGYNYAMQWLVVLPLELVAASITLHYWPDSQKCPIDVYVLVFYIAIAIINLFGARGYGEAEFVFSSVKVLAVCGFIILGIVLVCGGGPEGGYLGGTYWQTPGAFAAGFKGVCSVFVTAAFSFAGTELVGLASAESANPRKTLPSATKQVFWRITLFYIICLTLIGLLVPYDDEQLLSGSSSVDAKASPFVIAIQNGGIRGLPSVMNAVILIAVLSVGNSSVYGCSRTIAALAQQNMAPRFMGYIDKQGRPLVGIGISLLFGVIAFCAESPKEGDVFTWLLALSGLSSIFTWGSICLCHIRFRSALASRGRDTGELAFTAQGGVWGSYFGLLLNCLVLIAQFWTALFPIGASPDAAAFFEVYLAAPVVLFFYAFHKLWKRNWRLYITNDEMDIDSGRREVDLELLKQEIAEEKAFIASKPFYFRVYKFWC